MSKRLSKEELESDPLIENYNRAAGYISDNKTFVLTIAAALILVVGGIIGYSFYSSAQEQRAQNHLVAAENLYTEGEYEAALYGDDFELTYGFAQIAEEFPWTNAGNIANYYAAVSSYQLDDLDNALEFINEFDVPEGILGVGAISFHGNLLLEKGEYESAAQKYLEAAEWNENEATTPLNILKAAEAHYEAGNYDRAEELATRIIENYPDSDQITESQRLKGTIAALADN